MCLRLCTCQRPPFTDPHPPANGKTHLAEIRDICPTCGGTYDLDMSPSLFAYFGYTDHHGIFPITWEYVSGKQHLPNLPIPSWARPYFVRTGEI